MVDFQATFDRRVDEDLNVRGVGYFIQNGVLMGFNGDLIVVNSDG